MRCAGLLFATIVLAVVLCAGGCNTRSGSRAPGPDDTVGEFGIRWWPGINAGQTRFLRETVEEHRALLYTRLLGEPVPYTEIHFYSSISTWSAAFDATRRLYGVGLVKQLKNAGGTPSIGYAFIDPFDRSIHTYPGTKIEGVWLLHAMLHAVIYDEVQHADPRWQKLWGDDEALSLAIRLRR